jgi:CheY-like chemotaxis protein
MATEKRQKRVLYVEASDLIQASHPPALEKLNCLVIPVSSASAALEALVSEAPFDLIIVGDVSKPSDKDSTQPELSIISRARQINPNVPILLFTSHNYLEAAYRAGATAHLEKPCGVNNFIKFVTPYLLLSEGSDSKPKEQSDSSNASE